MNAPLVHTCYGYGLGIEAPGVTLVGGYLVAGRQPSCSVTARRWRRWAAAREPDRHREVHAPVRPDRPGTRRTWPQRRCSTRC